MQSYMQTQSAIRYHDPTIQVLARKYNKLIGKIHCLIDEWRDLWKALCPIPINTDNLFSLDVDDDIWQDIGLNEDDKSTTPPPWLSDENIQKGIRAMLDLDHYLEEEPQLILEQRSLQ